MAFPICTLNVASLLIVMPRSLTESFSWMVFPESDLYEVLFESSWFDPYRGHSDMSPFSSMLFSVVH